MKHKLFLGLAMMFLLPFAGQAQEVETIMYEEPTLEAGDTFRSETSTAVYYLGADGMRYVFPDDTTFLTWYDNFDDVKWVSENTIGTYQIGGNVTYRPGVSLLSIASNNTYYAVGQNGTLHPLADADVAAQLYGMEYKEYVNELPEAFFGNYTMGSEIELASQYDKNASMADAQTINQDKGLTAPIDVTITADGYESATSQISSGDTIRWTNTLDEATSVTEWDRVWGSGTLQPGETFIRNFTLLGTWHYYSQYQDRNTHEGSIIVE